MDDFWTIFGQSECFLSSPIISLGPVAKNCNKSSSLSISSLPTSRGIVNPFFPEWSNYPILLNTDSCSILLNTWYSLSESQSQMAKLADTNLRLVTRSSISSTALTPPRCPLVNSHKYCCSSGDGGSPCITRSHHDLVAFITSEI